MLELAVGYGVGSFFGILLANLVVYYYTKAVAARKVKSNKQAALDLLARYEAELADKDK